MVIKSVNLAAANTIETTTHQEILIRLKRKTTTTANTNTNNNINNTNNNISFEKMIDMDESGDRRSRNDTSGLQSSNIVVKETRGTTWYKNLVSGAIAGGVSRTFTAPFDRLKTVMQVMGSRKQITIKGGFQYMLNEGGVTSLWRGNGMNVIKVAPEVALKFAFYEEVDNLFLLN